MVTEIVLLLLIILLGQIARFFVIFQKKERAQDILAKRQDELMYLYFLTNHAISDSRSLEQRFTHYLNYLKEELRFTYHSIFRLDEANQVLVIRFTGYLPQWYMDELSTKILIRVGDLSVGRAVATKQPSTINAANFDPRFKTAKSLTSQTGYRSLSCYPLIGTLKIYGGFCAYSISENVFNLHDTQFFLTCANIYAAILENALLEKNP